MDFSLEASDRRFVLREDAVQYWTTSQISKKHISGASISSGIVRKGYDVTNAERAIDATRYCVLVSIRPLLESWTGTYKTQGQPSHSLLEISNAANLFVSSSTLPVIYQYGYEGQRNGLVCPIEPGADHEQIALMLLALSSTVLSVAPAKCKRQASTTTSTTSKEHVSGT